MNPKSLVKKITRPFGQMVQFIKDVANDPKIPPQDKAVLLALLGLVLSPVDIIPDWIPFFGQLDDIFMLALILDYFFTVLDSEILLAHYPWGMKSFASMKRWAKTLGALAPRVLKRMLWKYSGSPYKPR